jgi:hypothetical protein
LRRLSAVTADNDATTSINRATPTISTASAVWPPATPTAPSYNHAVAVNYGAAATASTTAVGFRFLIPLRKKSFIARSPSNKGFMNGINVSISCNVITARSLDRFGTDIGSGSIARKWRKLLSLHAKLTNSEPKFGH